tara:strand:- start:52 stop:663 length:612 start_codon:yes stop_codon:yes gene_type:complete
MPALTLTLDGANGEAHDWNDVEVPLLEIRTLLNTTLLDYLNVQVAGLRSDNLRSHANAESGHIKVRNDTGGTLVANDLVYFSGTYSDGTDNYPTVAKAVSTNDRSTTKYAQAIIDANIADGADGTVALVKEVTSLDTSALTVGDQVLLDDTAAGYANNLAALAATDYSVQVVGMVSVVSATIGRIVFGNWSIIPHSIADQSVQ